MRIGIGQINPTVGGIQSNILLIASLLEKAAAKNCDLVIFPELAITGYPPEDLLLKPAFIQENVQALKSLAARTKQLPAAIVGFVDEQKGERFNAAAWIEKGRVAGVYHKQCLPNYGVFDEKRYFTPGRSVLVRRCAGTKVGVTICEDIWVGATPLKAFRAKRAGLLVNISASPFHAGKLPERYKVAHQAAHFTRSPLLYCNTVGGQDELIFDGGSFLISPKGKLLSQCPQFKADVFVLEFSSKRGKINVQNVWPSPPALAKIEEIYEALVLGTRDYVQKNGFQKVALGLSGGIDSSLVACLAVDALGPERVVGVTMPSQYNLSETRNDAIRLAKNLRIQLIEIPIQGVFAEFLKALNPTFTGHPANIAEENLQARIRGTLLMALSNKFGWLILTTGNKSETSTGYSTLYGDTAGGFAVLKDVLKTTVYDLAHFLNAREKERIPSSVITRPPTAELRENQKDEDSLGPYAQLDPIIVGYVENNLSAPEIAKKWKIKDSHVHRIISLIDRSEYKRRQAPPGIKITPRSFGRDYRMPITNRYISKD